MHREVFCLRPLEGFQEPSSDRKPVVMLLYVPTDPNTTALTDSERARSCSRQGALGGAGQPREGQVRCGSNGT